MTSLRRLTSLSALATFEVAARPAGITRAAAELGATQAAVSRQMRALEADLGTPQAPTARARFGRHSRTRAAA